MRSDKWILCASERPELRQERCHRAFLKPSSRSHALKEVDTLRTYSVTMMGPAVLFSSSGSLRVVLGYKTSETRFGLIDRCLCVVIEMERM